MVWVSPANTVSDPETNLHLDGLHEAMLSRQSFKKLVFSHKGKRESIIAMETIISHKTERQNYIVVRSIDSESDNLGFILALKH